MVSEKGNHSKSDAFLGEEFHFLPLALFFFHTQHTNTHALVLSVLSRSSSQWGCGRWCDVDLGSPLAFAFMGNSSGVSFLNDDECDRKGKETCFALLCFALLCLFSLISLYLSMDTHCRLYSQWKEEERKIEREFGCTSLRVPRATTWSPFIRA